MAKPPEGKETCKLIHSPSWSATNGPKLAAPSRFRTVGKNASTLLDNWQQTIIAELPAFERTYRPEDLLQVGVCRQVLCVLEVQQGSGTGRCL